MSTATTRIVTLADNGRDVSCFNCAPSFAGRYDADAAVVLAHIFAPTAQRKDRK